MRKQECQARGCTLVVQAKMLMCKKHWFIVPEPIRDRVWETYREGQEENNRIASDDYWAAYHAAINAVAEKEGKGQRTPKRLQGMLKL